MSIRDKLILSQLNKMVDLRNSCGEQSGTLKVNQAALLFILGKFKTDTFRGFKLSCEK